MEGKRGLFLRHLHRDKDTASVRQGIRQGITQPEAQRSRADRGPVKEPDNPISGQLSTVKTQESGDAARN